MSARFDALLAELLASTLDARAKEDATEKLQRCVHGLVNDARIEGANARAKIRHMKDDERAQTPATGQDHLASPR